MTYNKLPAMYFTETVENNPEYTQEYTPLFIVQTATEIPSIDGITTEFTSINAFKAVATNKGLTKTIEYIEDDLNESNKTSFYVHSIKTDTAEAFRDILTSTAHLDDITTVKYIEETKSSNNNSIISKMTAIKNGLQLNEEVGTFRVAYVIPYGTVSDAVANAENKTKEEVYIETMESITAGDGDGRLCITIPDSMAGAVTGKCGGVNYDEEAGYTSISNIKLDDICNFTYDQMLTLQNLGVLFVRPEKIAGVTQYRINLGVTTSFKESSADGLLICRTIVDEMLRQIKAVGTAFIKAPESETTLASLNVEVSNIVNDFASEGSIIKSETSLTVSDAGNSTFIISGKIKPIKSIIAIEVNTTLVS